MTMKVFEVRVDVVNKTYESCYSYVEAETAEEARKLFDANPHDYDWYGWETFDSEIQHWEVDNVEYDEFMTKRLQEKSDG